MWIGEIDVHDDGLLHRYWEAGKEADGFHRPYAAFWSLQAATVALRSTPAAAEQHPIAAIDDDVVVATSQVVFPLHDNTHLAYIEPLVRPAYRRRGIGTALLQAALDKVRNSGRTTVIAEVNMPLEGTSEGYDFLAKRCFETGIRNIHRVLELPVAERRIDELAAAAAPHYGDYGLVTVADGWPDEYVDGYCALNIAFNSEAPMGDLDIEPEAWDAERVRQAEARRHAQGQRGCSTVAVAPDGSLVALTEMITTLQQPETGMQAGTLVLTEHRGHRLGLAIKVANLRAYQERFPAVRLVHSWNAEENGPMVAINDTLGFRPVERLAEMQRRL